LYAVRTELLVDKPQALLCFNIAKVGESSLNSEIKLTAESISKKLLYESFLPLSCSNNASKSP
jgi:hypothetical protein